MDSQISLPRADEHGIVTPACRTPLRGEPAGVTQRFKVAIYRIQSEKPVRTLVMATAPFLAMAATGAADAMSAYRWSKRPLVVLADAPENASLAEQKRIVAADRKGFAERDMVVVYVVGDTVTSDLGTGPGMTAQALRARFDGGRGGFKAVLVGKDGGAKLTSATPLSAATLFGTIDAMPMRRDEMRGR